MSARVYVCMQRKRIHIYIRTHANLYIWIYA